MTVAEQGYIVAGNIKTICTSNICQKADCVIFASIINIAIINLRLSSVQVLLRGNQSHKGVIGRSGARRPIPRIRSYCHRRQRQQIDCHHYRQNQ